MAEPLAWATFLGDSARFVLYAVILAMIGSAGLHIFAPKLKVDTTKVARILFYSGSAGLFYAFAVLISLFVNHQFQFQYVARHSKLDHEFEYLIAGTWSGQEGSFLLWAVASAIFGVIFLRKTALYERWFTVVYSVFLGLLAAILSYESPFLKFPAGSPQVADGAGMPPSLMNYWVVIHPPTIFLGFGSLTALFALAMAAMLHKNLDEWVKIVRPWALVSLSLLGVGLCMGGFWAYETLGWGGFWMWDPVENTSFVPWILVAALIHGIFVQLAKSKWHVLNAVLGGLPFVLFCYGTFLTRSGFLGDTSVHSFAQMDRSALWILTGLGGTALLSLIATAFWSAKQQPKPDQEVPAESKLNREALYGTGIWLLIVLAIFVAIGMSVPFLTGTILNRQQSVVEEKLYHQVLSWPFPFIALLIAVTPFVTWRGISGRELLNKIVNTLAVSIGLIGFMLLWLKWAGSEVKLGSWFVGIPGVPIDPEKPLNLFGDVNVNAAFWVLFLSWLCLFAILANLNRGWYQMKKSKTSFGGHLTHVGLMATLLGLVFSRGFEHKAELFIHPTVPPENRTAFGYQVDLLGRTGDYTNRNNKIRFALSNGKDTFEATPGLYFMMGQDGPVPQKIPYILSRPLYDLYFITHEFTFAGSEPTPLKKGETARFNNILVTYNGLRTEGPGGGMAGTKFYADLTVQTPEGTKNVSPYFGITDVPGQPEQPQAPVNEEIALRLGSLDAATGDASIIADYRTEMFPVEVYYKPLTVLVWWGVGIMALGGFLAAYSRRYKPTKPNGPASSNEATPTKVEELDDAPQHLAQV